MTQEQYDTIIACIKYGAPAKNDTLIMAFNEVLAKAGLANVDNVDNEEPEKVEEEL